MDNKEARLLAQKNYQTMTRFKNHVVKDMVSDEHTDEGPDNFGSVYKTVCGTVCGTVCSAVCFLKILGRPKIRHYVLFIFMYFEIRCIRHIGGTTLECNNRFRVGTH